MKITWLGQAGLLFETNGLTVMIDPYFSDSCEKSNPRLKRKMPIDTNFLHIKPDILILTHNHLDHTDPETLPYFINDSTKARVILSKNAHDFVKALGGGTNDYIIFNEDTQWTEGNVLFTGVKAYHSESSAFGVIIEAEGKKYYITGDTLYNKNILHSLPKDLYAVFLPINGFGNNMNIIDAARFAADCEARYVIPIHFGMFDTLDPNGLTSKNKIIPEIYKEVVF